MKKERNGKSRCSFLLYVRILHVRVTMLNFYTLRSFERNGKNIYVFMLQVSFVYSFSSAARICTFLRVVFVIVCDCLTLVCCVFQLKESLIVCTSFFFFLFFFFF